MNVQDVPNKLFSTGGEMAGTFKICENAIFVVFRQR